MTRLIDTVETMLYFNLLGDITLTPIEPVDTPDDHEERIRIEVNEDSTD